MACFWLPGTIVLVPQSKHNRMAQLGYYRTSPLHSRLPTKGGHTYSGEAHVSSLSAPLWVPAFVGMSGPGGAIGGPHLRVTP